jgi:hypothetical protein
LTQCDTPPDQTLAGVNRSKVAAPHAAEVFGPLVVVALHHEAVVKR